MVDRKVDLTVVYLVLQMVDQMVHRTVVLMVVPKV